MKIKYLKDAPQGVKGDVVDLDNVYARPLVAMGFAEYVEDKPKTPTKTPAKEADTKNKTAKKTIEK